MIISLSPVSVYLHLLPSSHTFLTPPPLLVVLSLPLLSVVLDSGYYNCFHLSSIQYIINKKKCTAQVFVLTLPRPSLCHSHPSSFSRELSLCFPVVTYDGRMKQFILLDSKGITTWSKDAVRKKGNWFIIVNIHHEYRQCRAHNSSTEPLLVNLMGRIRYVTLVAPGL